MKNSFMFSGAAGKGRFAAVEIAAPPPVRADAAQRVRTRRMHAPIHIGHMPDACRTHAGRMPGMLPRNHAKNVARVPICTPRGLPRQCETL